VTPAAVAAQAGQDGLILAAFVLLVALSAALVVALYWRHTNGR